MDVIGNDNANMFWEWNLKPEDKITSDADESVPILFFFIYI